MEKSVRKWGRNFGEWGTPSRDMDWTSSNWAKALP
jgi:hypothetical protein